MLVNSLTSTTTKSQTASKTPLAYKQEVQKFTRNAAETLSEATSKTHTPAQQSKALSQTTKIIQEAKQVVQHNPDAAAQVHQSQALEALSKETQAIKATVDQPVVVSSRSQDREEALKPLKAQLLQKMIGGLASDIMDVRKNARQALSKLGVSEKEMDQLRLVLEHQKMQKQKAALQFAGRFPVKLYTPNGIRFAGGDSNGKLPLGTTGPCFPRGDETDEIYNRLMKNTVFDDVANQAVQYHVNIVSSQLSPILFGGGQTIQLPDGTILDIPIGADRPALATVIRTW